MNEEELNEMDLICCIAQHYRKSYDEGSLRYIHHKSQETTEVLEDSKRCDVIGGIVWDGSLLMSYLCENLVPSLVNNTSLVGLGEGAGLTSIICAKSIKPTQENIKVIATDRYIDLLDINIIHNNLNDKMSAIQLDWEKPDEFDLNLEKNLIIFGVEVACLKKQQTKLINTIKHLIKDSSNSIILITFDDHPSDHPSLYEKQFIELMKNENFVHSVVFSGSIKYDEHGNGFLYDTTSRYYNDLSHIAFPSSRENRQNQKIDNINDPPPIPFKENLKSNSHHISAFYKIATIRTCKNCNKSFFPFLNDKCLHHKGYYVCRYHPGETNLNINGLGDGEGYYGGGKEGYEAKFWDCCGHEEKNHPGCNISYHESYS